MQLVAYLNFEGNAREAMDFYAHALGGKVTQRFTYGASPMAEQCGPTAADHVMHSQVEAGGAILMGADGPPPHAAGSTCVNILTETPEEAERVFAVLSEGGTVQMPLAKTFFSPSFGMVADRFGVPWMVIVAAE